MELNNERFALNFLCEFRNRGVESDFREYEKTANLNIVRFFLLFLGITFVTFIFSDYLSFGKGTVFNISLLLRGLALLMALGAFFLAGKFKRYDYTLLMISLTELLVFTLFLFILYLQSNRDPTLQFMSAMLFIMAVFLIPNVWKNSLAVSVIILVSFLVFYGKFSFPGEASFLIQRGIHLGVCLFFCALFIYGRERSQRRHFAEGKIMEHMIITDRLTGIYNRGRFEYHLDLWIKNMRHGPFCLILFDIDNFKIVNDRFGHSIGDQVLIATADVVNAHIRDTDIFARWGGEEFVILFDDVDIDKGVELAERLRKVVEYNDCGKAGRITISIGVAEYRRGESMLDLVERADAKMYEAKRAGRNKVIGDYENLYY